MPTAFTKGKCLNCGKEFWYVRYRTDKNYCDPKCRNRHYYVNKGTYSERERRKPPMSPEEWKEYKRKYDRERFKNPDVREAHNARQRARYNTDEYRAYSLARYYRSGGYHRVQRGDNLAHGYTGHRWFDLVREHVGEPPPESSVYFDRWAERMGEAVLALLEGRDVRQAVKEYNRREYIPNNRTVYMGEWKDEQENYNRNIESLGTSPSAEEETVARETVTFYAKTRYSHGRNRRKFGNAGSHNGRTAPTRRRSFKPYQDRPGHRR